MEGIKFGQLKTALLSGGKEIKETHHKKGPPPFSKNVRTPYPGKKKLEKKSGPKFKKPIEIFKGLAEPFGSKKFFVKKMAKQNLGGHKK